MQRTVAQLTRLVASAGVVVAVSTGCSDSYTVSEPGGELTLKGFSHPVPGFALKRPGG